ncbi:MAG: hypothetical protein HKN12_00575, partial [Gemmatimonadetes bacterium]|nr:hypothetical protein [Gemmatimonadota bacterium]
MHILPRSYAAVLGIVLVIAPSAARAADGEPRITHVDPFRDTSELFCSVGTLHLPGARIASSLESGLPSAIEMHLDLFDERDRLVGHNRVFLRVMFDLWEEVFRVEGAGPMRDFPDLTSLQGFLNMIPE